MTDMQVVPGQLKIPEVARRLNVSVETVRRYLRQGVLAGVTLPGGWRVKEEQLETFIKSRSTDEAPQEPTE